MLESKYCSIGQSFTNIAYVFLELFRMVVYILFKLCKGLSSNIEHLKPSTDYAKALHLISSE